MLEVLHSERFVDVSPEETWATLLDEGNYLCSSRTMYRILAAHHGGVQERRNQLTHPAYNKPELLAERPNELWSWDISKLKAATRGTWFFLYVILDVFSRYIVGWTVRHRETAELAKALIEQAIGQQPITPSILHADRGAPMRSKHVSELLDDLGVSKTHSRPYTSSDNPYSEANFKTLKYRPAFPARFDSIEHARGALPRVRALVQPPAPPLRDRADDPRRRPLRPRRPTACRPRSCARRCLRAQPRAVRPQAANTARATDRRVDQQASRREGGRSLNSHTKRLTGLDRLRGSVSATPRRSCSKRSPAVNVPASPAE